MGRWVSRDPIGEWGGKNLYVLIANSPLRRVDLLGLVEYDFDPENVEGMPYTHGNIGSDFGWAPTDYDVSCSCEGDGCCDLEFTISVHSTIILAERIRGQAGARWIYGHEQEHILWWRDQAYEIGGMLEGVEDDNVGVPCVLCEINCTIWRNLALGLFNSSRDSVPEPELPEPVGGIFPDPSN